MYTLCCVFPLGFATGSHIEFQITTTQYGGIHPPEVIHTDCVISFPIIVSNNDLTVVSQPALKEVLTLHGSRLTKQTILILLTMPHNVHHRLVDTGEDTD